MTDTVQPIVFEDPTNLLHRYEELAAKIIEGWRSDDWKEIEDVLSPDCDPEYRDRVTRLVVRQGQVETSGAMVFSRLVEYAPDAKSAWEMAEIAEEEYLHGSMCFELAEQLGVDSRPLVQKILTDWEGPHRAPYWQASVWPKIFRSWMDVVMLSLTCDPGGFVWQGQWIEGNFGPFSRLNAEILWQERKHLSYGQRKLPELLDAPGGPEQAQESLDRVFSIGLYMMGRPLAISRTLERDLALGVRKRDTEELRREYVNLITPIIEHFGLKVPDVDVDWNIGTLVGLV